MSDVSILLYPLPVKRLSLISLASRKLKCKKWLPLVNYTEMYATFFRIDLMPSILLFYSYSYLLKCDFYHAVLLIDYFKNMDYKQWCYMRYTIWKNLKLFCILSFTIFLLGVLALPCRNKWKHMWKTNHSLSFQICHELPDQREMRIAIFRQGPRVPEPHQSLWGQEEQTPKSALVP